MQTDLTEVFVADYAKLEQEFWKLKARCEELESQVEKPPAKLLGCSECKELTRQLAESREERRLAQVALELAQVALEEVRSTYSKRLETADTERRDAEERNRSLSEKLASAAIPVQIASPQQLPEQDRGELKAEIEQLKERLIDETNRRKKYESLCYRPRESDS